MSVDILYDPERKKSALYRTTTDIAFGPAMHADRDEVQEWLKTLPKDARLMTEAELERAWSEWWMRRYDDDPEPFHPRNIEQEKAALDEKLPGPRFCDARCECGGRCSRYDGHPPPHEAQDLAGNILCSWDS